MTPTIVFLSLAGIVVGSDSLTHSLATDAGADFDVRFFENHATFEWLASRASELCRQEPFHVGFGKLVDGNDAFTSLVITAFARAKANPPFRLS
jgi:hypothetical protein